MYGEFDVSAYVYTILLRHSLSGHFVVLYICKKICMFGTLGTGKLSAYFGHTGYLLYHSAYVCTKREL